MLEFLAFLGLLIPVTGAIIFAQLAWYSFCFLKLYAWFVLPVFTGLPVLTFWQAAGLACFTSIIVNQYVPIDRNNKEQVWNSLAYQFASPAMCLLIGWLIK